MTRVISVISGKGGVGKTTLAANLGALLAKHGKDVIVVDCNISTSHLAMHFGVPPNTVTLNEVLRGEKGIKDSVFEHHSGVKLIPASLSRRDLYGVDAIYLRPIIKELSNDFVLLDGPPGLGRNAHATIMASDECLVITTPDLPSVVDVVRCTEILNDLNVSPLGLVVNMRGRGKAELPAKEIEELTGMEILQEIPFDRNMQRAIHNMTPITLLKSRSPASRAFRDLARKILKIESPSIFERIKNILGWS